MRILTLLLIPAVLGIVACSSAPAADSNEPGVIFNFAGRGEGFDRDAVTKDDARFRPISDIAIAGDWLYVADGGNHVISRTNVLTGQFEIVAGTGKAGVLPNNGDSWRETPLPPINSIAVSPTSNNLYAVFSEPSNILNTALVQLDLNSGVFKVLLRDTVIRKVQVLNESQLLFNKDQKLFRYDLESGESRQLVPGVEIWTFAVGPEQTAYLFTSDSEPVILKLDFLTANSVDVIAGPFTSSPLLAQVRDDVDLLVNPRFVTSDIAVSTNGDVAVVDSSRYGSSIGVLVAGDDEFTVVAGKGPIDDTGDGRLATDATVRPGAIAFDEAGNLYLDSYTRIRRINRPEALN